MYSETIHDGKRKDKFYGLRCDSAEDFDSGVCCSKKDLEVAPMGEITPNTTRNQSIEMFFVIADGPRKIIAKIPPHLKLIGARS